MNEYDEWFASIDFDALAQDFNRSVEKCPSDYELSMKDDFLLDIISERVKLKLSQRDLAEKSGIRQSTLSYIESGKSDPRISTVLAMLAAMGKGLSIVDTV